MKKKLELISDMTGTNKSTVSKAIRHCFGVDPQTREQILQTARKMGLGDERSCGVYFIFPDRPTAFWNMFIKRFQNISCELDLKFNIYPQSSDYVLGEYLEDAKKSGARLVVSYAKPTECQYKLLCDAAKDLPIIFLFDRVDIVNTFFIGTDAKSDGAALRRRSELSSDARVLILHDGSTLANERISGFVSEGIDEDLFEIPENCSAAEIARAISAYGIDKWKAIYSASHQIREVALAAVKLKFDRNTVVLGHDFGEQAFTQSEVNGIRTLAICPDAEGIYNALFRAVSEYVVAGYLPDRKYTVIPSVTE